MPQRFVRSGIPYLGALVFFVCGCSRGPSTPDAALRSFSGDRLLAHIRILSSDEFEGRGPGSKGEQLTIQYLQDQLRGAGLEPGNTDEAVGRSAGERARAAACEGAASPEVGRSVDGT